MMTQKEQPVPPEADEVGQPEPPETKKGEVTSVLPEYTEGIAPELNQEASDWYQRIGNTNFEKLLLPHPDNPEMLSEDSLPAKIYYPLAEAAEIAKCKTSDLLYYGGMGKINLLIAVPDGVDLSPVDLYAEYIGNPDYIGTPMFSPEMLVLEQSHCRKIEFFGRTEQSDFSNGYMFSFGNLKELPPSYANPHFADAGCVWRTFHKDNPQKIELIIERLFVRYSDLTPLIKSEVKPE